MKTIEFTEDGTYCVQPEIGSINDTVVVEVTWDENWTGREDCLTLVSGEVVFTPNLHYASNRDYPSITDQLDQLYWDKKNNTNTWEEGIDAVKAEFPKGV